MARKAEKTPEVQPEIAPEVASTITQAQNAKAAIIAAGADEQSQAAAVINQRIGRRQLSEMVAKLLTVADLVDLQNIKESKGYKNFTTTSADGKVLIISTWDEYCEHVEKRSRQSIDNELLNLNALGPQLFESMRTVGLGPSTMRAIRQLPDDKQALIQQAVETADKDDLAEFIEQIIVKSAKEKEALQKQLQSVQDDIVAKDEVAEKNAKRMNDLEKRAVLLTKMPLEERTKELRAEISEHVTSIDHELRTNLWNAFENLTVLDGDGHAEFCKKQIEELRAALDQLDQQYGAVEAWME